MRGLTVRPSSVGSRNEILSAAADCFRDLGYSATTLDEVARRLGATKGMIYHHFRSKADLFFEVYREGMAINFGAVNPLVNSSGSALERLAKMAMAHALVLMRKQAFQRVLSQGVALHQQGSTTAAQRETLKELIDNRNSYEAMFRQAIFDAARESNVVISDASVASKSFLAVLNSTVYWYSPRPGEADYEQEKLAYELLSYALRGLGCQVPTLEVLQRGAPETTNGQVGDDQSEEIEDKKELS